MSNDKDRATYDQGGGGFGTGPSPFGSDQYGESVDFQDILSKFGGGNATQNPFGDNMFSFFRSFGGEYTDIKNPFGFGKSTRGRDLMILVEISFMEAAKGVEKKASFHALARCVGCNGSGIKSDAFPIKCTACKGQGRISHSKGAMTYITTCTRCGGEGRSYSPSDKCRTCSGEKFVKEVRNFKAKLRPGVSDGEELVYNGLGDPPENPNGSSGDLIVKVKVLPHHLFTRKKNDVHSIVILPLKTAILGGDIEVETIDGTKKISVNPGTQSMDTKIISGCGIYKRHGILPSRGDHVVTFAVNIPKDLTDEQKKLVEEALS